LQAAAFGAFLLAASGAASVAIDVVSTLMKIWEAYVRDCWFKLGARVGRSCFTIKREGATD
jgi:hypothetical protein